MYNLFVKFRTSHLCVFCGFILALETLIHLKNTLYIIFYKQFFYIFFMLYIFKCETEGSSSFTLE